MDASEAVEGSPIFNYGLVVGTETHFEARSQAVAAPDAGEKLFDFRRPKRADFLVAPSRQSTGRAGVVARFLTGYLPDFGDRVHGVEHERINMPRSLVDDRTKLASLAERPTVAQRPSRLPETSGHIDQRGGYDRYGADP